MYYDDLSLCHYHPGTLEADNWNVPLLTVGWLDYPNEFTKGTPPDGLLERLREFFAAARTVYSNIRFRGRHICSICQEHHKLPRPIIDLSEVTLVIPGGNVVYVASGGIIHYIETHQYLPPEKFIGVVMRCPAYGSTEFQDALINSNGGMTPPMVTAAESHRRFQVEIEETLARRRQNQSIAEPGGFE